LKDREQLLALIEASRRREPLSDSQLKWLTRLDAKYKVRTGDDKPSLANNAALSGVLEELQRRVDAIAPALVLGQGAYESGYGASRFAVTGHALFGQWTYDGTGMAPKKKRKEKGNYGVAAFEWPIGAVRSYMINLNTHRAYKPLRDIRAGLRKRETPLTGLVLADGLINYSEKGQEYVDTLKGIIRHNRLDIADGAYLRDDPPRFVVNVNTQREVAPMEQEIAALRKSGELQKLIDRMMPGD
jgi:Bax protein